MIGVSVEPHEREVAEEFFQLFKTAWEFAREGTAYDVLVATVPISSAFQARLTIVFSAPAADALRAESYIHYRGRAIAMHGPVTSFPSSSITLALLDGKEPVVQGRRSGDNKYVDVGYNLFMEVRQLLLKGQSIANAAVPALDLHIDLLRSLILGAGLPLVEIPPAPSGYRYITCLSHDIDHPVMRNHRFDSTMVGFVYRATIGTLSDVIKKRRPAKELWKNLWATLSLPLVHLHLIDDPWLKFDRFLEIERDLGATYFVIPTPGDPGRNPHEPVPAVRASSYRLSQIKDPIARITSAGAELGLHGLNAWLDENDASAELALVAPFSAQSEYGIRMHWLYFDEGSPRRLENVGLKYDSSIGYNETIGYRAGTTQVYRPFGAKSLLELPLHVMDTAMFFTGFLNLRRDEAMEQIETMLQHARESGGVVTINWHDRSLFAERHWGEFYVELVARLKQDSPWFPTIANAVKWFRSRREAAFVWNAENRSLLLKCAECPPEIPGMVLRTHRPKANAWSNTVFTLDNIEVVDQPVNPSIEVNVLV